MRRPLPAAVITAVMLGAVLLVGSGCAGERPRTDGQAPSGTASAGPTARDPPRRARPAHRVGDAAGGAADRPAVPPPDPVPRRQPATAIAGRRQRQGGLRGGAEDQRRLGARPS